MSGWTVLKRLVTRIAAEGVPGGTGWSCSSTGPTRQLSVWRDRVRARRPAGDGRGRANLRRRRGGAGSRCATIGSRSARPAERTAHDTVRAGARSQQGPGDDPAVIPIKDLNPTTRPAVVTVLLIALCTIVYFGFQQSS